MTLSLKVDTNQPSESGEYPLYIRIRTRNSSGKWSESSIFTDVYVKRTHIKNGRLVRKTSNYKNKKLRLDSLFDELEKIYLILGTEGFVPTSKLIKHRYELHQNTKELNTPKVQTFWKCFDEYLSTKKHKSRGYVKTIITLRNRLKDFEKWKKIQLNFEYVVDNSMIFQIEFQDFCWSENNHTNSYINKLLSNLSQFLFYCKERNYIQRKPRFKKNDTVDRIEKIYLYLDEVKKLYNSKKWDYEEGKDFTIYPQIIIIEDELKGTKKEKFGNIKKYTNWEVVKDIFLFLCSVGCRFSDIKYFKLNHFNFDKELGMFSWIQQKTDKRVNVPVNFISGNIFIKYSEGKSLSQSLFPSITIQGFNRTLKKLLKDLKFNRLVTYPKKIGSKVVDTEDRFLWELISSHSGRRTFIKNMIDMGSMDYQTIMSMSGHKTFSEFQKYVSVSPKDLKKGMKLYQMEDEIQNSNQKKFMDIFNQLSDKDKEVIIHMMNRMKDT